MSTPLTNRAPSIILDGGDYGLKVSINVRLQRKHSDPLQAVVRGFLICLSSKFQFIEGFLWGKEPKLEFLRQFDHGQYHAIWDMDSSAELSTPTPFIISPLQRFGKRGSP